jgi:hypothetical protein
MVIPIAGPIIVQGYGAMILKRVAFEKEGGIPPLAGLSEHLKQGVMPFLASLIWSLPITIVYYCMAAFALILGLVVLLAGTTILRATAADPDLYQGIVIAAAAVLASLVFLVGLVLTIVLVRWWHAADTLVEVTGKLEYTWKLGEIGKYLGTLGREGRLAFLRMILGNLVALVCGTLLCGLGVCFVPFTMVFASAHLQGQLYRLYLARGGEPYPRAENA